MPSYIKLLKDKNLILPPKWLPDNVLFEGMTGSIAYGVTNDSSDMDIIGFCMPPKDTIFPHLRGEIPGFGKPGERFEQFQQHHIKRNIKTYDITIYSIIKFFQLTMENNPNMIDALFLPRRCVLYNNSIYEKVRERRHLFLHKGCWHKFKGYAYSQLIKLEHGVNKDNPKRKNLIESYGYDTKFGYHIIRLILECEQILIEKDLDLERNKEILKSVRRGEWTLDDIKNYFKNKELELDAVYLSSDLQHSPDEGKIKQLLLECIEDWYGDLSKLVPQNTETNLINDLELLIKKYSVNNES